MNPVGANDPTAEDRRLGYKVLAGIVVLLISLAVFSRSNSKTEMGRREGTSNSPALAAPSVPTQSADPTHTADSIIRTIPLSKIPTASAGELLRAIYAVESVPKNADRTSWLAVARVEASRKASAEGAKGRRVKTEGGRGRVRCASADGLPAPGYQTLVANVSPGKELFLASDCSRIGTIADVQSDYRFPDGTLRDAVLISFADGSADWIPRKTVQLLYITR